MYQSRGSRIVFVSGNEDMGVRAECTTTADADRASEMLNRAGYLNDVKRKYTAAARLIAAAETVPGFRWIDHTAR
jgi:hypothetical protein